MKEGPLRTTGEVDEAESLRLRICPACDYSLEALPAEGVCPECGRAYDTTQIVLVGRGRGRYDQLTGGTWRGALWTVAWAGIMFVVLARSWRGRYDPVKVGFVIALAAVFGVQLAARLLSGRDPRMQLWLSPRGIVQVASTRAARRAVLFTESLFVIYIPAMLGAFVLQGGAGVGMLVVWATVTACVAAHLWLKLTQSTAVDWPGDTPPTWPWRDIAGVRVDPLGPDRFRVRARAAKPVGPMGISHRSAADVEVELSPAHASRLQQLVVQWRGGA